MKIEEQFVEAGPMAMVDRRYRVKREVARGGMGIVHEAEHTALRGPVALKTLTRAALDWPLVHARLLREARALSMVRHPGVVSILDAGICPVHGPFVALEMIDGRSLESFVVARRGLDAEAVVRIAAQLGSVLAFVHDRGIVHRDLKPGNVLVEQRGSSGDIVKLLDFGISVVPGDEDVIDRKLTHDGEILGTVEYMAPEQLIDGAPPSVATDVYGLGVTLYECLMGDVPFPGAPTFVVTALLSGKTPPSIRAKRPEVPPALEAAIFRALARDPAARFPRADAFASACVASMPHSSRGLALYERNETAGAPSRRQFARAAFVTPVRILSSTGNADGRTEDISEGGLLVVTNATVREGEQVSVRMPLPGSGRVVVFEATTRWARTRRGQKAIGLAFVGLSDEARNDIRTYIALMGGAGPTDAESEAA